METKFSTIFILLSIIRQNKVESLPFFAFGGVGDASTKRLRARNDDVSSNITATIPHYGGNSSMIFVSENGVISLDTALPTPPQTPGPSLYQDAGDTFLIAPYWADNDISESGGVHYEVYEQNHADQVERFDLVGSFIANNTVSSEAFEGSWMILVGWEDCPPNIEAGSTISDQTNSFQALVVTDGISKSYAIFTYECNQTEWPGLDPIYAKIGINYGGGMEQLHNFSGGAMANEIDCMSEPDSTVVNVVYDLNVELNPSSTPLSISSSTPPSTTINAVTMQISMTVGIADVTVSPISTEEPASSSPSEPVSSSPSMRPASSRKLSGSTLIVTIVVPVAVVIMMLVSGITTVAAIFICKKVNKKNKILNLGKENLSAAKNESMSTPHPSFLSSTQHSKWAQPSSRLNLSHIFKSKSAGKNHVPLLETDLDK